MRIVKRLGVACVVAAAIFTHAHAQRVSLTYIALKTTTDTPPPPDKDGIVTLTLASGAYVKLRPVDIDYDRTWAYKRIVVTTAETVTKLTESATNRQYVKLTYSRGFVATVWLDDVDYDVMRSGFALYHQAHGDTLITRADVATKCENDWPDDYQMQLYCRTKQQEALTALEARQMASATERGIRAKCDRDWPTDYAMRNYCEEQQLKALAALRR